MADTAADAEGLTAAGLAEAARQSFRRARQNVGETEIAFRLAGRHVRLSFAGSAFRELFERAIAGTHWTATDQGGRPALHLHAWDAISTGAPIDAGSWLGTMLGPAGVVDKLSGGPFHVSFDIHASLLGIFDLRRAEAFHYAPDAAHLPAWERTHPARLLWAAWGRSQGLQLCHAAAVADGDTGVLLVGPSGSGKSTTALACLGAGLACAGDDYVLVESGARPVAHALFRTVSLEAGHALRHGHLLPVVDRVVDMGPGRTKAIMAATGEGRPAIEGGFPLSAVAVPRVTPGTSTSFTRIGAAVALRALAPSTLSQLGLFEEASFRALAEICRARPCYALDLGSDIAAVPEAIRALLHDAAKARPTAPDPTAPR